MDKAIARWRHGFRRWVSSASRSRVRPLPARGTIDAQDFGRNYVLPGRPGHFKGLVSGSSSSTGSKESTNPYHWPSVDQWPQVVDGKTTLRGMLSKETSDLLVPVEISNADRGYNDSAARWDRFEIPFATFLDAFINESIPWKPGSDRKVGYMAQHDLLARSNTLALQCPRLPHTLVGSKGAREQWQCNTWIGPAGTFTPIHRDPHHNLFIQVAGQKRVHLFPPQCDGALLVGTSAGQRNTSVLATEDVFLDGSDGANPKVDRAVMHADSAHVLLEPGDALFLPMGWLHCVRSMSVSASVNFWFR